MLLAFTSNFYLILLVTGAAGESPSGSARAAEYTLCSSRITDDGDGNSTQTIILFLFFDILKVVFNLWFVFRFIYRAVGLAS